MEIGFQIGKGRGTPTGALVVVCGMAREAELAEEDGTLVLACGGNVQALESRLDATDPETVAAVVSFGLAGALDAALGIGDVIVPDAVTTLARQRYGAAPRILDAWRRRLPEEGLHGEHRTLVGVDRPALTHAEKVSLRRRTAGAAAVDMESHVAGAYASRHDLPFGVLRVISDDAERDLPPVAADALAPDGSVRVLSVLGGLLRRPGQIGSLVTTARDARTAFAALGRVRRLLGPRLGLDL